jgi:SAM-dependent methyltransferase
MHAKHVILALAASLVALVLLVSSFPFIQDSATSLRKKRPEHHGSIRLQEDLTMAQSNNAALNAKLDNLYLEIAVLQKAHRGHRNAFRDEENSFYCPKGSCVEGRGDCIVGQCICYHGFHGDQCQNGEAQKCEATDLQGKSQCAYSTKYGSWRIPDLHAWHAAQTYEVDTWKNAGSPSTFDRLDQHLAWFNEFKELKDYIIHHNFSFGYMLELGSGPWTQSLHYIKAIGEKTHTINSISLLDPLIDLYLQYVQNVQYRDERRSFGPNQVPIILHKSGIEQANEYLKNDAFDTIVMVNVVEHCLNAFVVFQTIYNKLKPGGLLIFHEYNYDDHPGGFFWEQGHPIKLHAPAYDVFLQHFTVIYRRDFNHEEPGYNHAKGVYFIGRKK